MSLFVIRLLFLACEVGSDDDLADCILDESLIIADFGHKEGVGGGVVVEPVRKQL